MQIVIRIAMRISTCLGLIIVLIFLNACSTSSDMHKLVAGLEQSSKNKEPLPYPLNTNGFELHNIQAADIFALSKEQQTHFLDYFHAQKRAQQRPHQRVRDYLETSLNQFSYRGETFNAQQAMDNKSGNCLSLAILSTAFTKLTDLKYKFKRVHVPPVYEEFNDIQVLSSHVNFSIYDQVSTSGSYLFSQSKITIDYFRTSSAVVSSDVSETELMIMYWHNLTADALLAEDLDLALSYAKKALTQAFSLAYTPEHQQRYEAKLSNLKSKQYSSVSN